MNLYFKFEAEVWHWRGPSPFYFATVPTEPSLDIKGISSLITYGWGVIPATVTIGDTRIKTALFPKDGKYLVPLKAAIRKAEQIELGDTIEIELEVSV